jgi:hypothetical protein
MTDEELLADSGFGNSILLSVPAEILFVSCRSSFEFNMYRVFSLQKSVAIDRKIACCNVMSA